MFRRSASHQRRVDQTEPEVRVLPDKIDCPAPVHVSEIDASQFTSDERFEEPRLGLRTKVPLDLPRGLRDDRHRDEQHLVAAGQELRGDEVIGIVSIGGA